MSVLRMFLPHLCLLVIVTPTPSQGNSLWVSTGPTTPEKPSAWLPLGNARELAPSSPHQNPYSSTAQGQSPGSGNSHGRDRDRRLYLNAFKKDPNTFRPFHWDTIISVIMDRVSSRLYGYNEFELLNHQCAYRTSPVLMSWNLHILAKVWCPGWTRFTGKASTTRLVKSIELATRDFVRKAVNNGIVSVDDAQGWL